VPNQFPCCEVSLVFIKSPISPKSFNSSHGLLPYPNFAQRCVDFEATQNCSTSMITPHEHCCDRICTKSYVLMPCPSASFHHKICACSSQGVHIGIPLNFIANQTNQVYTQNVSTIEQTTSMNHAPILCLCYSSPPW
jgi:hypothetical protein